MNRLIGLVVVVAALCVVPSSAVADIVNFSYGARNYTSSATVWLGDDYTWHGGSFSVHVETGSLPGSPLLPRTFCVESDIYFTPGDEYYATVDSFAAKGLAGNPDTGVNFLTKEAAWIYQQYVSGGLNAYADHSDQAISEAIWYNMSQVGGVDNEISKDAAIYATGIGNVRVMNLWTLSLDEQGEDTVYTVVMDVQSHLIMIPAPGAVLLGMIGFGLIGWVKRRFA